MCVRWARGYNFRINSIVIITCKNNNERKHKLNGPNSGETTDPLVYINVTNFNFFLRSIEFLFRFVFNLFRFDNDIFSAMLFQYSKKKKLKTLKLTILKFFENHYFCFKHFLFHHSYFHPDSKRKKQFWQAQKEEKVVWSNQ